MLLSIGYGAPQFTMFDVKLLYILGSQSNSIPNTNVLACSIDCDLGDIGQLLAVPYHNTKCTNPGGISLSRIGHEVGIHVENLIADQVED